MLSLVLALAGYHLGTRRPSALVRCTRVRCSEASTIQYGGIPHVAVIVGDAEEALAYYTEVLGTTDGQPGASRSNGPNPNPDPNPTTPGARHDGHELGSHGQRRAFRVRAGGRADDSGSGSGSG